MLCRLSTLVRQTSSVRRVDGIPALYVSKYVSLKGTDCAKRDMTDRTSPCIRPYCLIVCDKAVLWYLYCFYITYRVCLFTENSFFRRIT